MHSQAVLDNFARQAKACDDLGSPFTARLCRLLPLLLDRPGAVGERIRNWPGNPQADALALRVTGALHMLVLSGADPQLAAAYPPHAVDDNRLAGAVAASLGRHDARIADFLSSAPQTNETGRAAMLLPGFLLIARETGLPLALAEIGASAGLNLFFDRFRYDYAGTSWGAETSAARLAPEVRGMPPLDGELAIASRAGNDIAPVDVSDAEARLRLRAYVWADQAARLARLDAAMAIAMAEPAAVERSDAADFVRARLAARPRDAAFVLFHTIMWQYMPAASKAGVMQALEEAGREATPLAPIARLRMEPLGPADHATLSLTMWPGGQTRRLARCDFHGRWIDWTGE
jgi:hypothetical protein